MPRIPSRRAFVRNTAPWLAVAHATQWLGDAAAEGVPVIAPTSSGRIRGTANSGVNVFKGIPYGGPTGGRNRFMPPTKPLPWTDVRDALAYGPTAPQALGRARRGVPPEGEDCLVLNVFTPAVGSGRRPVMVWLHGGGFSTGSGSSAITEGISLTMTDR